MINRELQKSQKSSSVEVFHGDSDVDFDSLVEKGTRDGFLTVICILLIGVDDAACVCLDYSRFRFLAAPNNPGL